MSIGIAPSTDALLEQVKDYLEQGYLRIKLKIEPGIDVDRVRAVRAVHPSVLLSVDANAAYSPADAEVFRSMDDADLLMIEQPLHHEDLLRHAELQALLRTDLCLDESIRSAADASAALELLRLSDREHQAGTGRRCPRGEDGSMTSASNGASPCGAEGCSRPGSAVR